MRRSVYLRIATAGLLLGAFASGGGTCGTAPPGGDALPSGGRVTIKLENQASCAVVVDLEFALIGGDIRRTTRRLAPDGAESEVKLLPTLADTVSILAIGDPSSISASACNVRDERLLIFGRDFEDGSELTLGIQPLPPPPAPQPTFDCNANGVEDALDISTQASRDCNNNQIPDECDIASGFSQDCDRNAIPDACDIASGTSTDCDNNSVPDQCQSTADCNENGSPDFCDLLTGTSQDINGNQVPDSCEPDCNHNGIPDDWDLGTGTSQDCNENGRPDECDLADGTSHDCNCNGVLDECDIASGTSVDRNSNSVPDECEGCQPLDIVFVMDTSGSIRNEARRICDAMSAATSHLASQGIVERTSFMAIRVIQPNDPEFGCLTMTVVDALGPEVPGSPPCCPTISSVEDWGPAVAIVAERYPWQPFSRRAVIAVTDEAPMGGDPCEDPGPDRSIIDVAKAVALANHVGVGVILAQGDPVQAPCYTGLANEITQGTGGSVVNSTDVATQLESALLALQQSGCVNGTKCP